MDSGDHEQAVVIDNGSGTMKAGLADEMPAIVLPSIVARTKDDTETADFGGKQCFIGEEALAKRGDVLELNRPISRGTVTNWDDIEKIWQHIFYNELKVDPKRHPVLMTGSPLSWNHSWSNLNITREKIAQVMFETFHTPAVYVAAPAALSLYSRGKLTGCVVEIGDGVAEVTPIREGNRIEMGISGKDSPRLDLAGRDLTDYLRKLLHEKGYRIEARNEMELVRDIKEKLCYTALDYEKEWAQTESSSKEEKQYKLPDGSIITIGNERFTCPEALFKPEMIGLEAGTGFQELICRAIQRCDPSYRLEQYMNIFLTGGSTKFPGFAERTQKELTRLTSHAKVETIPDSPYSAWIGGSILASLDSFQQLWVTRKEYDECGPSIVRNKCVH